VGIHQATVLPTSPADAYREGRNLRTVCRTEYKAEAGRGHLNRHMTPNSAYRLVSSADPEGRRVARNSPRPRPGSHIKSDPLLLRWVKHRGSVGKRVSGAGVPGPKRSSATRGCLTARLFQTKNPGERKNDRHVPDLFQSRERLLDRVAKIGLTSSSGAEAKLVALTVYDGRRTSSQRRSFRTMACRGRGLR